MKLKQSALLITSLLVAGQVSAMTVYQDDQNKFDVGGVFVLDAFQPKWGDDEIFSAGRSILNFGFERQINADTSIDAKLEWDQFLNSPTSGKSNFRNRLGYVTVKNEQLGSLRFGKQWSAYHDVARYMDNLVIIDPDATPIYSEGTDGGFAATGRGDNLVAYRYNRDGLNVSAHYGFTSQGETGDIKRAHNYAASTSYDFDFGLSLGVAYLENKVSVDGGADVNGLKDGDKQKAATFGGQYVRDGLKVSAVYTKGNKIHKAGLQGGNSEMKWADADAMDVYAHYAFASGFRPYAYASHVDFKENDKGIGGERQVYALGVAYAFTPETILTFEAKQNKLNEFNANSSQTDNGGGFNFAYIF
ncbi:porin [Photobacterium jeanii]|uniref:Porin n=1 Tax=Photobacterium jeanii TaxID=858640 RepID=A0A178KNA7_9GAMM|nr:porin [Photobacterium jeanii]OAN18042.1 porin [Photobacterium jeanii]PST92287.1 porin [Photobacterium jeanii]